MTSLLLSNINYKGKCLVKNMKFPLGKPQQVVDRSGKYPIIFFKSGRCRIMGCKQPLKLVDLKYKIQDLQIQSITVTADIGKFINLYELQHKAKCMFEPEIFPALRLQKYNPVCVNVFSSGKVVLLGIKTLDYNHYVENIISEIKMLIN